MVVRIGGAGVCRTDLAELMVLAARDQVTLHTTTYPLNDFARALDDLDHGRVQGRAILVP